MSNPNPNPPPMETRWKPGESGNPLGAAKGRRSLPTIIKDILEEEIDWDLVPVKHADDLAKRYNSKKAWEALVYVAFAQAISGNMKAAAWLSKTGYGDKLDLTSGDKPIQPLGIYDMRKHATPNNPESGDQPEADRSTGSS